MRKLCRNTKAAPQDISQAGKAFSANESEKICGQSCKGVCEKSGLQISSVWLNCQEEQTKITANYFVKLVEENPKYLIQIL